MTGKERLQAVMNKRPKDRLAWTTLVDNATLNCLPANLRGNWGIDFYRHLGCDIFMLSGWNTPYHYRSPEFKWPAWSVFQKHEENGKTIREYKTPKGTLKSVTHANGHPDKYLVDSIQAVAIYREMWEGVTWIEHDDSATHATLAALVGADGIITRFWTPSAIPRLLEIDMGVENFYYMFNDHRAEMDGLIRTMHAREIEAWRNLASGPWDSVTLAENTSTYYISPDLYQTYNMPHQRDFVDIVKQGNKVAILHMCGHVRGILPLIKETGCDGIHALTPPPTGNTPWEEALDVLGEDLIILGCLPPSIFVTEDVKKIGPALDALITPRLKKTNFVLMPCADGIAVGLDRFMAVKQWVESQR